MKTITRISFMYSLFLFAGMNVSFSQIHWDSLGTNKIKNWGPNVMYADSNSLYMAGQFTRIGGRHMQGIAKWNGAIWDSMGGGIDGKSYLTGNFIPNNTWAMTSYHNKLYVGGQFSSLGKINAYGLGAWDGTKWDSMPEQPFKLNTKYNVPIGAVQALCVMNNKLYVGGGFDTVAGFPCLEIACWNDTNWSSLNFPSTFVFYDDVEAICEYNGSLYAGGGFNATNNNDTVNNILRWDGKNWHSVGDGGNMNGWILSMAVYKGELYVAGYFSGVDNNIQRWDGTKWSAVGGGTDYEIFNLTVYNNKLYVMGEISEAGGIPASYIATWDGTEWCSLGSTFDNTIGTACVYKDSLYIGGGFRTIDRDSISYIAEWTGGDYTANCSPAGVSEVKGESENVKVYPNPTMQDVTMQLNLPETEQVKLSLFNLLGEIVFTENLEGQRGIFQKQIPLTSLPDATYILKTETKEKVYYNKITKFQ